MKLLVTAAVCFALLVSTLPARSAPTPSPRSYAQQLAAAAGWAGAEWVALDWIVGHESGWNPCRHYPSTTDCSYGGSASCGIPQAQPCPWPGRLWASRFEQVRWLIRYVRQRYGRPSVAKAFWSAHRWY